MKKLELVTIFLLTTITVTFLTIQIIPKIEPVITQVEKSKEVVREENGEDKEEKVLCVDVEIDLIENKFYNNLSKIGGITLVYEDGNKVSLYEEGKLIPNHGDYNIRISEKGNQYINTKDVEDFKTKIKSKYLDKER